MSKYRDKVVNLWSQGWTIGYVAHLAGVSRSTVKDILDKENLRRNL